MKTLREAPTILYAVRQYTIQFKIQQWFMEKEIQITEEC